MLPGAPSNPYNQNPPGSVESVGPNPSFPASSTPDLDTISSLIQLNDNYANHPSPAHLNQPPGSVEAVGSGGGGSQPLRHPSTPATPQGTSCPSTTPSAAGSAPNSNSTTMGANPLTPLSNAPPHSCPSTPGTAASSSAPPSTVTQAMSTTTAANTLLTSTSHSTTTPSSTQQPQHDTHSNSNNTFNALDDFDPQDIIDGNLGNEGLDVSELLCIFLQYQSLKYMWLTVQAYVMIHHCRLIWRHILFVV